MEARWGIISQISTSWTSFSSKWCGCSRISSVALARWWWRFLLCSLGLPWKRSEASYQNCLMQCCCQGHQRRTNVAC
jgi:hypothetical protein